MAINNRVPLKAPSTQTTIAVLVVVECVQGVCELIQLQHKSTVDLSREAAFGWLGLFHA